MSAEPRYVHDCDNCVFLGDHRGGDAYVCPQGNHPTIVVRWSDEPPHYDSGQHILGYLDPDMATRARASVPGGWQA